MILYQIILSFSDITALPLPMACGFIVILGAIIGSFLNVVVHRLPRGESIVFPNSRCPACSAAISPFDNVPILSYLLLGGRCRSCKARISPRYPAVEGITALMYGAVFWRDGVSAALPCDLLFVTALIALVFIDAEHMILPNAITYPGMILAFICRAFIPVLTGQLFFDDLPSLLNGPLAHWPVWAASMAGGILGALAGGGSLWLMGWLWKKLRGVDAMGLGDVKMMVMVGAYFGWRLAVLAIFLAVFSGSLTGVFLMIRSGRRDMQMMLPFGIFLGVGSLVSLFIGVRIVEWYATQF